jgi:hypothetical protein
VYGGEPDSNLNNSYNVVIVLDEYNSSTSNNSNSNITNPLTTVTSINSMNQGSHSNTGYVWNSLTKDIDVSNTNVTVDLKLNGLNSSKYYSLTITLVNKNHTEFFESKTITFFTDTIVDVAHDSSLNILYQTDVFLKNHGDPYNINLSDNVLSWAHQQSMNSNYGTPNTQKYHYIITAQGTLSNSDNKDNKTNHEYIIHYESVDKDVSENSYYSFNVANTMPAIPDSDVDAIKTELGSEFNPIIYYSDNNGIQQTLVAKDGTNTDITLTKAEVGYNIIYSLYVLWQDQDGHIKARKDYSNIGNKLVKLTEKPVITAISANVNQSDTSEHILDISYNTGGNVLTDFYIITTGEDAQYLGLVNNNWGTGTFNYNSSYKTEDQSYQSAPLTTSTLSMNNNILIFIGSTSGSNVYSYDLLESAGGTIDISQNTPISD